MCVLDTMMDYYPTRMFIPTKGVNKTSAGCLIAEVTHSGQVSNNTSLTHDEFALTTVSPYNLEDYPAAKVCGKECEECSVPLSYS